MRPGDAWQATDADEDDGPRISRADPDLGWTGGCDLKEGSAYRGHERMIVCKTISSRGAIVKCVFKLRARGNILRKSVLQFRAASLVIMMVSVDRSGKLISKILSLGNFFIKANLTARIRSTLVRPWCTDEGRSYLRARGWISAAARFS